MHHLMPFAHVRFCFLHHNSPTRCMLAAPSTSARLQPLCSHVYAQVSCQLCVVHEVWRPTPPCSTPHLGCFCNRSTHKLQPGPHQGRRCQHPRARALLAMPGIGSIPPAHARARSYLRLRGISCSQFFPSVGVSEFHWFDVHFVACVLTAAL